MRCLSFVSFFTVVIFSSCITKSTDKSANKEVLVTDGVVSKNVSVEQIAGNQDVAEYMHAFDGRGIQTDDSLPTPPKDLLKGMYYLNELKMI